MDEPPRLDALLARAAALTPGKIAVEDPDRGRLTYEQLQYAAQRIASVLQHAGCEGERVGICAPKSLGVVAAIFGILTAKAAYVPVDCSAPPDRNAFIFNDCAVHALVTTHPLLNALNRASGEDVFRILSAIEIPEGPQLDLIIATRAGSARGAAQASMQARSPEGLAYVLYTSGSTGKPKGVMHSHSTALSFIDWCSEEFAPTADDRFSSHAPFHFDLSVLDLYAPIKHGASIVLISEERGKQPQQLAPLIASSRISVWYSTPSVLRLLAEFGRMERFDYSALRLVLYAGEVFPPRRQRALRTLWPHPRYYNLYGPTETNVCTFDRVEEPPPEDYSGPLPIGRVCSGDRVRVIELDGREAAPGSEGELQVCGGTVMLGYWNLPERNEAAFQQDADGVRWYRTGDLVREDGSGRYLFLGRRDRMVKRRGYRVELGEIEAALHRHESICEAAVIPVADADGGVLIKAFVVCVGAGSPSIIELKALAARLLPAYMIPDRFVVLPTLPKTSTDKLDYQKLRALA